MNRIALCKHVRSSLLLTTMVLLPAVTSASAALGPSSWRLVRVVDPPDSSLSRFGVFVDVHGGMVVASGFTFTDGPPYSAGSAFTFSATGTDAPRELMPSGGLDTNTFVYPALSADRILIGDDEDPNNTTGSAYLFDRATGEQIARLTAPDGVDGRDFWFGQGVALTPQHAIVMAVAFQQNGIYVYEADNGQFVHKIVTGPPEHIWSMAANSRLVLVGDPDAEIVYLYDVATGDLVSSFSNPFPGAQSGFGFDVALGQQYAAVSSLHADSQGPDGVVSIFDLETGLLTSTIEAELQHPGAIDIDGSLLIVGGPGVPGTPTMVYDVVTGSAMGVLPHAESVAIDGRLAVLGASAFNQAQQVRVYMIPEPSSIALITACALCGAAYFRMRHLKLKPVA